MTRHIRFLHAAALALALAACNRNASESGSTAQAPAAAAPAAATALDSASSTPAPIPPATEVQVTRVESVVLSRPAGAPDAMIIHASGRVASAGWTEPKLAPVETASPDARIRVYAFVATSPEMPADSATPQAVETELRIDDVPREVRTIRIQSATNAISAPVVH